MGAAGDSFIDGAADGWWEWDEGDPAALAEDAQDAVAVFLAQVADVDASNWASHYAFVAEGRSE